MATKYTYTVLINSDTKGKSFFFSYGNTKFIELVVNKQKASVSASLSRDYSDIDIYDNSYLLNLIKESLKRVMLVHLLKYMEPINMTNISLKIIKNGVCCKIIDLSQYIRLYSMIQKRLIRPIPDEWKQESVIESILAFQKSKLELSKEISALYAYIYSKTKSYETERFSYLWMSMNGFYSSRSDEKSDAKQMTELVSTLNLGNRSLTRKERDSICPRVVIKLNSIDGKLSYESLSDGRHKDFAIKIQQYLSQLSSENNLVELSAYGFMVVDFPYYLRCKYFHANKPLELFSFEGDMELRTITIANGLLEEFLDKHLYEMFLTKEES